MNLKAFMRNRSRGNEKTLALYTKEIGRFVGWLGSRALTLEAVDEYEDWLAKKYAQNSRIAKLVAVNLYLEWKGVQFRARPPTKEYVANPRLVDEDAYREKVRGIADPAERLIVRLQHDSLLRPCDLVTLRLAELADVDGVLSIRKKTKKTGKVSDSYLTVETAAELKVYVAQNGITDYVFPSPRDSTRPRHRTFPNKALEKNGMPWSPRDFRRTGATNWPDDNIPGLIAQGSWTGSRTIFAHYKQDVAARHRAAFEKAIGKATDADDDADEPPGYA